MITINMTALSTNNTESEMLNRLFELEGIGISSDENEENDELLTYYKNYSKQISFENGYATAPFPLKTNVCNLADNYSIAIRRLLSLHRHLEKNFLQKEWYCKILHQYEKDAIIEKVKLDVSDSVGAYYMPFSGVWRAHKPKPLRIVFDESSKRKDQLALNDVLHKDEPLIKKIHDIIVASRTSKIVMACDIEAAFTQIRLRDSHKDHCRFLWFNDPDRSPSRDNIIEYRFKRVPFGAKPSPSILSVTLLTFLRSKNTELSKEIIDNLFVDNMLLTANDTSEAIAKYKESKSLLPEIGVTLREYISNCEEVNKAIPEKDRANDNLTKAPWCALLHQKGSIYDKTKFDKNEDVLTKKDVVSQLNSIYDPIGIADPLTIRLKHLMREIYEINISWKEPVPKHLAIKWFDTCQELNAVSITLPRYLGNPAGISGKTTLWVFADASAKALATCAFFRDEESKEVSRLISGQTRLTPKKPNRP